MRYSAVVCISFFLLIGAVAIAGAQTNRTRIALEGRLPDDSAWKERLYSTLENRLDLSRIHPAALEAVREILPSLSVAADPEDTALFLGGLLRSADGSIRRGENRIEIRQKLRRHTDGYDYPKNSSAIESANRKDILEKSRQAMQNRGRPDFFSDTSGTDLIEGTDPGGYIPDLPYGN